MTTVLPLTLPDGEYAVVTRALNKRYGSQTALRDLTLQVPVGSVYLLVGPNGSGKSTTIKMLLDLVVPDAGSAQVFGMDVGRRGPEVRANIGYVPEQPSWGYGWMPVGQLLEYHAQYFTSWDREYAARLARAFDLTLERKLSALSKGQARRVHLIMALAHRPPLLLLDEPTDGLDPIMRDETIGILAEHLADTPTTVLLSTHHVAEVEQMADHIGALRDGELRAQISIDDLRLNLRCYRAQVPDVWKGVPTLNGEVLRRSASAREVQWTVWGNEAEITRQFAAAGATVREAATLSLHEATLALLARKENHS